MAIDRGSDAREVGLGHDQEMTGTYRIDVAKCDTELIFEDYIRRYLPTDYLVEYRFTHA